MIYAAISTSDFVAEMLGALGATTCLGNSGPNPTHSARAGFPVPREDESKARTWFADCEPSDLSKHYLVEALLRVSACILDDFFRPTLQFGPREPRGYRRYFEGHLRPLIGSGLTETEANSPPSGLFDQRTRLTTANSIAPSFINYSLTAAKSPARMGSFKNKLLTLDTTLIELCASVFDWAQYRRSKAAVKLRLLLVHLTPRTGYLGDAPDG